MLTTEPRTRSHLSIWLISVSTYVVYSAIVWVQVGLGFTDLGMAVAQSGCVVVANGLLYMGIRKRWGPRGDRSLGITQLLVGIGFMWWSYAIAGPVAAATVIIVASHIVYAMFSMPPRQVWQLVALSLSGLALTMTLSHLAQPARYAPGEQFVSFLYITLVVVLIARLAALVARMNEGLRTQSRELASALERVRQLATRDELTQVHNRRHITELLVIERNQHERTGHTLCVALLDIDHFKAVNDKLGHQAGDEVLRRFAMATQQALRASDLLGRWGGEEFIVVFPDTSLDEAAVALQRVRERLTKTDFSHGGVALRVTFSAGLVNLQAGEQVEHAVERADQAMYRAKTHGRDCVMTDLPPGSRGDVGRRA
ncbi:MAG TPA: GGDEF domain-containing protein [Rhizobacter sp.]